MPPWNNAPPGLHPIRGATVTCHLLVDGRDAWVLDTGLIGEPLMIRRKLRRLGLDLSSVRGIVLTHGHLDHAGNLALLQRWTGAPVYGCIVGADPRRRPLPLYGYRPLVRPAGGVRALGAALSGGADR